MNRNAVRLVIAARSLVERWRTDAAGGDLGVVNEHIESIAFALHGLGVTPEEIGEAYAPDCNVVGMEKLGSTIVLVGTAIVGSLEGIRTELRLRRDSAPRTDVRHRQESLDRAVSSLADRCDDKSRQAALDE